MRLAILRRSIAAAAVITLLTVPSAFAESVETDGKFDVVGNQMTIDVGTVAPGEDVPWYVYFPVTCSGTNHVDANQSIRLSPGTRIVPSGGGYSISSLSFQLPSGWPADGAECPTDLDPYVPGPLYIILTAPTTEGTDYHYRFTWNRSVTPASANDTGVFSGTSPQIDFYMDVATPVVNTPPELQLPADSEIEGNATGGAAAAYAVTATDAEDSASPTPSCSPAVGQPLSLGPNTISCSVQDSGGLEDSGSFQITVIDTTDPTLVGMPDDVSLTTSDPAGATLTYTPPTASDVVDSAPTVQCTHASGWIAPVGDGTVTCTATDHSGNDSSASFNVHVELVQTPPPPSGQARWEDPVGASAGIVVNGGRTVPVKVWLGTGDSPVTSGDGLLSVVPCDGGSAVRTEDLLPQSSGRWMGHLDTAALVPGCYRVVASVDGLAFGSFRMDVRGASVPSAKPLKHPLKAAAHSHRHSYVSHGKGRGKR